MPSAGDETAVPALIVFDEIHTQGHLADIAEHIVQAQRVGFQLTDGLHLVVGRGGTGEPLEHRQVLIFAIRSARIERQGVHGRTATGGEFPFCLCRQADIGRERSGTGELVDGIGVEPAIQFVHELQCVHIRDVGHRQIARAHALPFWRSHDGIVLGLRDFIGTKIIQPGPAGIGRGETSPDDDGRGRSTKVAAGIPHDETDTG